MAAKLIAMSGLPAAGKSAIAEALGRELGVPVFAKDWLEAPILRARAIDKRDLSKIGYELLATLARRQLESDQSAILDCVAGLPAFRDQCRELAAELGAAWLPIECVCSNSGLHRERLAVRIRGIPDWPELTWAEVERVRGYFVPWDEERLVLDSVLELSENVQRALRYVARPGP